MNALVFYFIAILGIILSFTELECQLFSLNGEKNVLSIIDLHSP